MTKFEWTREELAAQFERVTGESAANYPEALAIDFLAWIRDAEGAKARAQAAAKVAREMGDEDLDEALDVARRLPRGETIVAIEAEISRRAEIKVNRRMDLEYGDNRYGFTDGEIGMMHDASWYASRQTEDEFLAEMGECPGCTVGEPVGPAHVPTCVCYIAPATAAAIDKFARRVREGRRDKLGDIADEVLAR